MFLDSDFPDVFYEKIQVLHLGRATVFSLVAFWILQKGNHKLLSVFFYDLSQVERPFVTCLPVVGLSCLYFCVHPQPFCFIVGGDWGVGRGRIYFNPKPRAGTRVTPDSNSPLSFSDLFPVWGPSWALEGQRRQVLKPRETGFLGPLPRRPHPPQSHPPRSHKHFQIKNSKEFGKKHIQ